MYLSLLDGHDSIYVSNVFLGRLECWEQIDQR